MAAAPAEEEGTKGGRRPAQAAEAPPLCPSPAEWLNVWPRPSIPGWLANLQDLYDVQKAKILL